MIWIVKHTLVIEKAVFPKALQNPVRQRGLRKTSFLDSHFLVPPLKYALCSLQLSARRILGAEPQSNYVQTTTWL